MSEFKTQDADDEMSKVSIMLSHEHTMRDILGGVVNLLDTILHELRELKEDKT